ncbi:nucleolar complex protein 4 homolog isoform X4 [Cygnus atratus]|uniref:nucleolar complex protein 4 homolog isoform X4 n=1 Tax=Cygnus atratus TaxID=8868 RepID=UPI0015D6229B|nr:nucleolar complex protein 4 homolog isoform X4 [Cygnus atratus]
MAQPGLAACLEAVLGSRGNANRVYELLERLAAAAAEEEEEEEKVLGALRACGRLFGALLERGELFVGRLPAEEAALAGGGSAEEKYKVWMRHRYNDCVGWLAELMGHGSFQVKELSLCTLMKFVELEAEYPLVKVEWKGSFTFPRELLKVVVDGLIPLNEDASLLISRFQEYMEYDDIRYFVMKAVTESIGQVMQKTKERPLPFYQQNIFSLISPINMPNKERDLVKFMVKQGNREEWKVSKLQAHKQAFERMWLSFLKHKLPTGLYKKVLVILHDSILPYMNEPTLMIDFLTVAYGIGGAISLLALNGLFILIHQHNLEYPDFYKKLYSLLDPSIYHVKYRARFFHLLDLFLSSSHLPAYLVAAFIKRLSRLALTAPPEALLMVIPFICNLFRRHPACKVLVHRPNGPADLSEDPYIMEQEEPSESKALESSLWELQALQNHYHPDVAQAAATLNQSLSEIEDDISGLLELSASELFDKEVKKSAATVPLEFEQVRGLFGKKNDIFAEHFSLD